MYLSIVVPVYKEETNIPVFLKKIPEVLNNITEDYEIIFALDPSPDRSEEVIINLRQNDNRVKLLKFSRRIGQPMATLGGLSYSQGKCVIIMDVDMQDPPELIPAMLAKWNEGFDVVLPQRVSREGETLIKKIVAHYGYKLIAKIADVPIPPNTGDFRLLSRRVVDHVVSLKESHGFLRGMVALVGFKQCTIPFERPARFSGTTNYNRFIGSLKIGFNGVFGFSSYALTIATQLGFLVAGTSFILAIVYLIMKLKGFNFPLGNPTLVIIILFLGGIQLIGIGILGEYIGRIYEEVRQRPKFIIDKSIGF
jgi:dolichol-phosphate mannosyltransferase